jgi:hypothetical protein
MQTPLQRPERQLLSKTATTTYHEVHRVFYFSISHLDFWMLGITKQ